MDKHTKQRTYREAFVMLFQVEYCPRIQCRLQLDLLLAPAGNDHHDRGVGLARCDGLEELQSATWPEPYLKERRTTVF